MTLTKTVVGKPLTSVGGMKRFGVFKGSYEKSNAVSRRRLAVSTIGQT